jgi:hypothetical protein
MSSRSEIRKRIREIENAHGPAGIIRLDDPAIDASWLYAGSDPGFELDWLRDPAWRVIRRDVSLLLYRHRKTRLLRVIGLRQRPDAIDLAFE